MLKKLLILFFGVAMLASCNESYNSLYEDVEEPDPNVNPPGEVDLKNVNILPTLSDPLYNIITSRSGGGLFGDYEHDREHWLGTRFHVFGMLTANKEGGMANYNAAKNGDKFYGILWNQTMGISNQQGHSIFYDNDGKPVTRKYFRDGKLHRYKFFMFGTDGLDSDIRVESNNRILATMKLDGKHDVVQSFAFHTDEQYADIIRQLPKDETTKVFLDGGWNYMYNRLSGNRGLQPIFNTNHLLSMFEIMVKGGQPENDETYDFLKVFVNEVSIGAPKDVEVVVADDKWERESYLNDFIANRLIRATGPDEPYLLPIVPNEMGNTPFTTDKRPDMNFDALRAESDRIGTYLGESVIPEGSHWVGSTDRTPLCKTTFLPPIIPMNGKFVLSMKYRYVNMRQDESTGEWHIGAKPQISRPDEVWDDFNDIQVEIPNVDSDGNPVVYKGGHKYTIIVTVYGKSTVNIEVASPTMWEPGGDINIDEDKN